MFKSLILFFRRKNIKRNLQQKRLLKFPDIMKSPVMAILIDDNQKKDIKSIEQFVRNTLNPRKLRFVVLSETLPDDQLQNDSIIYIVKKDFNVFGILKKEKESLLRSFSDDLFVDLSDNNKNMLNDYLVSCVNSSFKIGHSKINMQLHDLIVDCGIEKDEVERMKIIYKYLLMLSGNKNEK
ncbi:MAG: hypothetical protein J6R17_08225 [Bacteroidales bacterium]|nr:hypothetical protein [Bacteroidales bacterium]